MISLLNVSSGGTQRKNSLHEGTDVLKIENTFPPWTTLFNNFFFYILDNVKPTANVVQRVRGRHDPLSPLFSLRPWIQYLKFKVI